MPQEFPIYDRGREPIDCYIADCSLCTWDQACTTLDFAQVLIALHAVVRHPEDYRIRTGKDPELSKFYYKEYIERFQRYL